MTTMNFMPGPEWKEKRDASWEDSRFCTEQLEKEPERVGSRTRTVQHRVSGTPIVCAGMCQSVLSQDTSDAVLNLIVARELARHKETCFSELNHLEVGASCTFWNGRPKAEGGDEGAVFVIQNKIVERLFCLLQGTNDRFMTLRLPLRRSNSPPSSAPTFPPITSCDEAKNKFYGDLHAALMIAPKTDKLIGDFNVLVDTEHAA
nr:unnamed protein product [Spirometra erinaceieuropaei]